MSLIISDEELTTPNINLTNNITEESSKEEVIEFELIY